MSARAEPDPPRPHPGLPDLNGGRLGVVGYRFRGTLRARRGGYLALVLIIGLTGGIAMASIAAGRRTQSSYPTYLATTNPSDLNVAVYSPNGGPIPVSESRRLTTEINALPEVSHVRTALAPQFARLTKSGGADLRELGLVVAVGSLDGLETTQDRLAVVAATPPTHRGPTRSS